MGLPHFAWPYRLGATVEQDSSDELRASAAVILCTPRGQRVDEPTFGVTSPLFEQVPIDIDALATELAESDGRLAVDIDDVTELVDVTVARLSIDLDEE